jgi:hypothetical protein
MEPPRPADDRNVDAQQAIEFAKQVAELLVALERFVAISEELYPQLKGKLLRKRAHRDQA